MYFVIKNYKYFPPGTNESWSINATNYSTDPGQVMEIQSYTYKYLVLGAWPVRPPTGTLEDVVTITATPNVFTKSNWPNAYDPVSFTLDSTKTCSFYCVKIGRATIFYNITAPNGSVVAKDQRIEFFPTNSFVTTTYYDLPGLPTGYKVEYYIVAYDDFFDASRVLKTKPLDKYKYEVNKNNIWVYPDKSFEDNIRISSTPNVIRPPYENVTNSQTVNITIQSRYSNVSIQLAYLNFTFKACDTCEKLTGTALFSRYNSTTQYIEIPVQGKGVMVEFSVLAYDIMYNPLESIKYNYTVKVDPKKRAEILSFFYVVVYDETGKGAKDYTVRFSNETWESVHITDGAGVAYPNVTGFHDTIQFISYGRYVVEVSGPLGYKKIVYDFNEESNTTLPVYFKKEETQIQPADIVLAQISLLYYIPAFIVMIILLFPVLMAMKKLKKRAQEEEYRLTASKKEQS